MCDLANIFNNRFAKYRSGLLEHCVKMTAKHRGKGKNNHKNEENSFRHEVLESEARGGGHHYTLLFILFLMIVIGGATATWFCVQQHQTITYLADNLMGMQMKIVKLQSFQEEIRQSSNKVCI